MSTRRKRPATDPAHVQAELKRIKEENKRLRQENTELSKQVSMLLSHKNHRLSTP